MTETCRRQYSFSEMQGGARHQEYGGGSTLEQLGMTEPAAPENAHHKVGSANERRWHHEGFSLSSF